jgi:ubiquinone/menaquinone biosynthesis C-methylase UbiE
MSSVEIILYNAFMKNFRNTIKWYDEHAEEYSNATFQTASTDLIDTFVNYLPSHPKVLDAGCGSGRDCNFLHESGAEVTGVDLSKGLLDFAKKQYHELQFVQANFLDLPFENESFDGLWAHAALVHLESIEDVKKALVEFHRVLRDKGILHVYVRERPPTGERDLYFDKERYFRYFTQEEMGGYVKSAGFIIKENTLRQSKHKRKGIRWICIFAEKE